MTRKEDVDTALTALEQERARLSEFARRIQQYALSGAARDNRPDKSDWIRLWTVARGFMGLPVGRYEWETAYNAYRQHAG